MGLLKEMNVPIRTAPVAREVPAPVPAPVIEEVQVGFHAPVPRNTELTPKRNAHGLIESVTGYNAAGEEVTFEFERDGKKSLERIKVK
jgi:hypothetical protein